MWTIEKEVRFEASHQLPHHDGKCARLHGHSWVVFLGVASDRLIKDGPKAGMVMDFGDVKAAVQPLMDEKLDHWHLNDTLPLENPTSEEIARWLYNELAPKLPRLQYVTIKETCTSGCTYVPDRELW